MDMEEIRQEFPAATVRVNVKRKRTKRLRQSHSTSVIGGGSGGGDGNENITNSLVSSSPATSTSTEAEDEDIAANCLILLARSGDYLPPKSVKGNFSFGKFTEMVTTTNGKVGVYVYECKTCNRTFPSFQALGGHRASHKKPKSSDQIDQKKSPPTPSEEDNLQEDDQNFTKLNAAKATTTAAAETQLIEINKNKIHECTICRLEFASGQALGGHMRRHRTVTAAKTANNNEASSSSLPQEKTARPGLSLDLNLPAPPEEEFHQFAPSNQQQRLVFPATPALVDCYY